MSFLVTADLHLTGRPADKYRFRFFKTLTHIVRKYSVSHVIILGDITDQKDCHSSELVNKIVGKLAELAELTSVIILKGNHDYVDPTTPFFSWLTHHKNIRFITEPTSLKITTEGNSRWALFLPHTHTREGYGGEFDLAEFDYIFAHQRFDGAMAENGQKMTGMGLEVFAGTDATIYSGDIHVPQKLGPVLYVGAPYPIHFGDNYEPRVLLDNTQYKAKSIPVSAIRKLLLKVKHPDKIADFEFCAGDQVKIELRLDRSDFPLWDDYRRSIVRSVGNGGAELFGLRLVENKNGESVNAPCASLRAASLEEVYKRYCKAHREEIDTSLEKAGRVYLEDDKKRHQSTIGGRFTPKSLELEGFRSYREKQVFDFPSRCPGFFFVSGDNQIEPRMSSNAAGKSGLFDSLVWCLYGKTARGTRGQAAIVSWGEGSCFVETTFERGKNQYRVRRSYSPNTLTLQVGKLRPRIVTQEDIDDVVGLDYDCFMATGLLGQFNKFFFDWGPTERLNLFSAVLDLDDWVTSSEKAKKDRDELQDYLSTKEKEVAVAKGKWQEANRAMKECKEAAAGAAAMQKEQVKKLLERRKKQSQKVRACAEEIGNAKERLLVLRDRDYDWSASLKELWKEYRAAESAAVPLKEKVRRCEWGIEQARKEADTIKKSFPNCPSCRQIVSRRHIKEEALRCKQEIEDLEIRMKTARSKYVSQNNKVEAIGRRLEELEELHKNNAGRMEKAVLREERAALKCATESGKLRDIDAAIEDARSGKSNPYTEMLRKATENYQVAKVNKLELEGQLKDLRKRYEVSAFWTKGFREVRLWLMDEILRELEMETNSALVALGLEDWKVAYDVERETKSGTVAKGFQVFVTSPESKEPVPWESWSGGETQRLRIAGAIGVVGLINRQRGVDMGFLAIDEADQLISPEGVSDMLRYLHSYALLENKQVYVVSQSPLSRDFGEFNSIFRVVKTASGSRVT